jgi:hypothetical protein
MPMTLEDVLHQHPWLWKLLPYQLLQEQCPECGTGLGQPHAAGCDVPRCTVCGQQRLGCSCGWVEIEPERWIGTMYAQDTRVALEQGFFCRCLIQDPDEQWRSASWHETLEARKQGRPHQFWVPCGPHDAGASPDLNAAACFQKRAKLN